MVDAPEPLAVSVALCTHNGARFVAEQVASILTQVPPPRELVVGDDASTDDTLAEVERVVAQARASDPAFSTQVTIIRRDAPLGVTANFESTIAACSSPLIALSDQDDVWPAGRLGRLVRAFDDPSVSLVHSDARLIDAEGRDTGARLLEVVEATRSERAALEAGDAWPVLLRRNLVTGATVVVRAELAREARPFPASWVHDEWLAAVAAARDGLRLIDQPLLDYRQHDANVIGAGRVTWGRRWQKLREPRADRAARLVARAAALAERAADWGVSAERLRDVRQKLAFEAAREQAPRWQPLRVVGVLRRWVRGDYARFARGPIDVVRDLVQPPGAR